MIFCYLQNLTRNLPEIYPIMQKWKSLLDEYAGDGKEKYGIYLRLFMNCFGELALTYILNECIRKRNLTVFSIIFQNSDSRIIWDIERDAGFLLQGRHNPIQLCLCSETQPYLWSTLYSEHCSVLFRRTENQLVAKLCGKYLIPKKKIISSYYFLANWRQTTIEHIIFQLISFH